MSGEVWVSEYNQLRHTCPYKKKTLEILLLQTHSLALSRLFQSLKAKTESIFSFVKGRSRWNWVNKSKIRKTQKMFTGTFPMTLKTLMYVAISLLPEFPIFPYSTLLRLPRLRGENISFFYVVPPLWWSSSKTS